VTAGEACDLLVNMTRQCCIARAERDEALAERDATRVWLRASLHSNISLTRENWTLREQLRREVQQHADLRVQRLLQSGVEA
jgi:hypothetical protein